MVTVTTTTTTTTPTTIAMPPDPLIFGFWKVDRDSCASVCYEAIQNGYRRLDCACDYGNEKEVGEGITKAIQDGLCTRKELFITSKLWNTYHSPEHVTLACQRSLDDLQLTYLDEYLIHFPISMEYVPFETKYPPEWLNLDGKMIVIDTDMCLTWKAMEELVTKHKMTKTIGVCNFTTQLLRQLLSSCTIRPSTLQIEVHPHNSQQKLIRFAHENNMTVTAFSTFGSTSYVELSMATENDSLFTTPSIVNIAKLKNKSSAQILIRWAIQRHTFPLTKTVNSHRMRENRLVFDFNLSDEEMTIINNLNKNYRYNDPGVFCEGMGVFCPIYE
jgi:D-xylose reductase